jgi:hypothetical protein
VQASWDRGQGTGGVASGFHAATPAMTRVSARFFLDSMLPAMPNTPLRRSWFARFHAGKIMGGVAI